MYARMFICKQRHVINLGHVTPLPMSLAIFKGCQLTSLMAIITSCNLLSDRYLRKILLCDWSTSAPGTRPRATCDILLSFPPHPRVAKRHPGGL